MRKRINNNLKTVQKFIEKTIQSGQNGYSKDALKMEEVKTSPLDDGRLY